MGVGKNWVVGISEGINRGGGRIVRVCLQGGRGYETGLFTSVIVYDVVLVWNFCALFHLRCNSVAVHIVTLSEFH